MLPAHFLYLPPIWWLMVAEGRVPHPAGEIAHKLLGLGFSCSASTLNPHPVSCTCAPGAAAEHHAWMHCCPVLHHPFFSCGFFCCRFMHRLALLPGAAAAACRMSSWVYHNAQAEHGETEGCSHDSLSSRLVLCFCQLTGCTCCHGKQFGAVGRCLTASL